MRFVVILFLARLLSVGEVGLYGLVTATVAYMTYALGLDLYAFTTREIIGTDPRKWRTFIGSHFALTSITQVVFLPISLLFFVLNIVPWDMLPWVLLLASTEQVSSDIDRLLVSMSKQYAASVVIFIRQGVMPLVIVPSMFLWPTLRSVSTVFAVWIAFNLIAILIGLRAIARSTPKGTSTRVDWAWLQHGLRICIPLLFATLCLRSLFSIDRQIVSFLGGLETTGVYSLAMGLAAGLTSIISIAVHQFVYPRLVAAAKSGDLGALHRGVRGLWLQTLSPVAVAIVGTLLLIQLLLHWIGKDAYSSQWWVFVAAMAAVGIYNLSLVPHYALYALHKDGAIIIVTVLALALWVVSWFAFASLGVIPSALVALTVASFTLLVGKQLLYARVMSEKNHTTSRRGETR